MTSDRLKLAWENLTSLELMLDNRETLPFSRTSQPLPGIPGAKLASDEELNHG